MSCAKKWLFDCSCDHTNCRIPPRSTQSRSFRPTRLIEIGQPESHQVRLQLFNPPEAGIPLQYATLSHCWGATNSLKLTSTSLQGLISGIPVSDLAKTFQDAIFTARSLGIKFMWIDSLCILQDSKEDWQRESALMSEVYSNGCLNIAASIAADSDAACFPERSSSALEPFIVQTDWCNNGTSHISDTNQWNHALQQMPLSKRAWAIQEKFLAPRTLFLCGRQMFWECYELTACEEYPGGMPYLYDRDSIRDSASAWGNSRMQAFGNSIDSHIPFERRDVSYKKAMWSLWADTVSVYSLCELTYASDKLIALSGVAKIMAQVLEDEYCAGLWRSRLVTELYWSRVLGTEQPLPPPDLNTYRAPSWSWATYDGPIYNWEADDTSLQTPLVDIIQCDVKTATSDRTGAVVSGALRLSGWLATLQIHETAGGGRDLFFDGIQWRGSRQRAITTDYEVQSSRIHCLALFVRNYVNGFSVDGLLLVPTGAVVGQFRRVGIFSFRGEDLGLQDWKQFSHIKNEAWMEYEKACDGNKYIISII
jgi:hypothetical protein